MNEPLRRRPGLAAGALALLLLAPTLGLASPRPVRSRTVRFVYQATVRDIPADATRAALWIPSPPDTAYQTIRDLTITSDLPHEMVNEVRFGNRAVRFALPPGTRKATATLSFEVTRFEHRHEIGAGPDAGAAPEAATTARATLPTAVWLQPDRRVPLDATIRGWAKETVAGQTTSLGKARAIYDYVVDNLSYDKTGTGWGQGDIYWACDARRGNCTDFHAIFIGYARAVGIPARFEIGFPLPADRGQGQIGGYHCWTEFNVEGEGWIPVDASEANKHPERREYFFGAHDENRVLFTIGRDLVLPGMQDAPLNFFIYPYVEVDGAAFSHVERQFSYQDVSTSPPHTASR
ncbi:MAG: transglutaminase-like domain-containing protein [Acidobacteriota bacterium]